jgi:DNA-binding transcriptional LysR family regulator
LTIMLDALTLDQLRLFLAVVETGSFRAAAARLLRVQSAVSQGIANLEAELGVRLFDRSGYRPTLTPAGQALLADARTILLKVDFLRARARGLGEGVELRLGIVVDTLYPLASLGAALRELHATYPSVEVHVALSPLGGPLAALRERRCTLGIMVGEDFPDPRIEQEALAPVPVVTVAAADHPLAARGRLGRPLGGAELAEHLQIVLEDPTPLSAGRDFGVLSPRTWRVSDQAAKQALILAGLGWGRLPVWSVSRHLAEGRLVAIPAAGVGREGERSHYAYLAHRTDEPLGPAAQVLRQALLRRADAEHRWRRRDDRAGAVRDDEETQGQHGPGRRPDPAGCDHHQPGAGHPGPSHTADVDRRRARDRRRAGRFTDPDDR